MKLNTTIINNSTKSFIKVQTAKIDVSSNRVEDLMEGSRIYKKNIFSFLKVGTNRLEYYCTFFGKL